MAPKKRLKVNDGTPKGWRWKNGAWRYRVPVSVRHLWDGQTEATLGKTLPEAYRTWAEKIDAPTDLPTMDKAFDRYLLEEVPTKSYSWQSTQRISINRLRKVFGKMRPAALKPVHVYKYHDLVKKENGLYAAKHDVQTLRHVLTKCVDWGCLENNFIKGNVRIKKTPPRNRFVEDWEIAEALSVTSSYRGVLVCNAYTRFKLMTGLRRIDILNLRIADLREDGIHVTPSKTADTTGRKLIIEWVPELRELVEEIKRIPPRGIGFLFVTRTGKGYLDANRKANGFDSMWQRFMDKCIKDSGLVERFQERDLRAKVASESDTLEQASALLGHASTEITNRVYRRKPVRVLPLVRK